jgi:hypothetical protein
VLIAARAGKQAARFLEERGLLPCQTAAGLFRFALRERAEGIRRPRFRIVGAFDGFRIGCD